jgi:hypothetical protein
MTLENDVSEGDDDLKTIFSVPASSASPKFPFSFESGLTTTSDVSGVTNSYLRERKRARS